MSDPTTTLGRAAKILQDHSLDPRRAREKLLGQAAAHEAKKAAAIRDLEAAEVRRVEAMHELDGEIERLQAERDEQARAAGECREVAAVLAAEASRA